MDETAKTEARNYLSAAGFFVIAAGFLLPLFISESESAQLNDMLRLIVGIGMLIISTLLIILRKRDMIAILFSMMGFTELFWAFTSSVLWYTVTAGFILLAALITLMSKDKKKWILFLIPLIYFIYRVIIGCIGNSTPLTFTFFGIIAAVSVYCAFACASERFSLPGKTLLTADEETDFKASGSVLGYLIFAQMCAGYAQYYIFGSILMPFEVFTSMILLCGSLMILVAVLLFAVGKMRFTPVMFLLIGLLSIMAMYTTDTMFIGIGILFIVAGIFAILRKESRILPGIMMIVFGCSAFFSVHTNGTLTPVVSFILNAIPCLIAIYLAFAVYSQKKLPKF